MMSLRGRADCLISDLKRGVLIEPDTRNLEFSYPSVIEIAGYNQKTTSY